MDKLLVLVKIPPFGPKRQHGKKITTPVMAIDAEIGKFIQ
jgi:hypothetical protein